MSSIVRTACPHPVQWLNESLVPPRQEFSVLLLYVRGICKHHRAEITGGGSGPDRPAVAPGHEVGKPACVVDVSMRKDHSVQLADRHRQGFVLFGRFDPLPLEHPAVEGNGIAIHVQEVA